MFAWRKSHISWTCPKQIVSFDLQEDSSHVVDSRWLGCPVPGQNNTLSANKYVILCRDEPITELEINLSLIIAAVRK